MENRWCKIRIFCIALAISCAHSPVMAQQQQHISEELSALRDEALELSQSLKDAKRDARQTSRQLDQWQQEEAVLLNALLRENAHLSRLLSRMIHASRAAPLSLLSTTKDQDWVRQAKLMDMTSQYLRSQSSELHHKLSDIDGLRQEIEDKERALSLSLNEVAERYAETKTALQMRQEAFEARQPAETKMQRLERQRIARQARNLEALLALLERESGVVMLRSPQEIEMRGGIIALNASQANFQLPAQGTIIQQFGDTGSYGTAQAVHIRTSPRGLIYAPAAGEIVFSGPFRSYGSLLMVKHEGGFMSLVSGFGDPAVAVGQLVVRGEPIGYMPRKGESVVSFELRKERKAIDPMPLIAHSSL